MEASNLELQLISWDIYVRNPSLLAHTLAANVPLQFHLKNVQNGNVGIPPWAEAWLYKRYNTFDLRLTDALETLKVRIVHCLNPSYTNSLPET